MSGSTNVPVLAATISAAAVIAAAVVSALISSSISKRGASQKLAEMREDWINDLRDNIAYYVKLTHKIGAAFIFSAKKIKPELSCKKNMRNSLKLNITSD